MRCPQPGCPQPGWPPGAGCSTPQPSGKLQPACDPQVVASLAAGPGPSARRSGPRAVPAGAASRVASEPGCAASWVASEPGRAHTESGWDDERAAGCVGSGAVGSDAGSGGSGRLGSPQPG
jgi:hypothetical protein